MRVTDLQSCKSEANFGPLRVAKSFFSQEKPDVKMQVRHCEVRFTRFVAQRKKLADDTPI